VNISDIRIPLSCALLPCNVVFTFLVHHTTVQVVIDNSCWLFQLELVLSYQIPSFLKVNLSTQPQPFGVRNEMGNPKGVDMKPLRGFYLLGGS
jgi:hypothetical protein